MKTVIYSTIFTLSVVLTAQAQVPGCKGNHQLDQAAGLSDDAIFACHLFYNQRQWRKQLQAELIECSEDLAQRNAQIEQQERRMRRIIRRLKRKLKR